MGNETPFEVVYYLWNKDHGVVKIGTTKLLWRRLEQLRRQHPAFMDGAYITSELGSYPEEKARHEQFAASRIGGEFFLVTPDLQAHIDQLNAASDAAIEASWLATFGQQ